MAISNSMSSFAPKYWLNWQIPMDIFNECRKQDGANKAHSTCPPLTKGWLNEKYQFLDWP